MNTNRTPRPLLAVALFALVAVLWAYWTTLTDISERWATDPQYSHGFLVPLFAAYLAWSRCQGQVLSQLRPRWWGIGLVLVGVGMRLAGHLFYQPWLDAGSLLVVLAGLVAAAGGRPLLTRSAPAILFLAFMIPLPYRAQMMLGGFLQKVATTASTYGLQTLGVPAVAEGNVILLPETRLGVVEACNGLSMLVTFFALAAAVAILARRGWLETAVIILSAAPIAVLANVTRITVTGLLFEAGLGDLANVVFHDLAGWLMMPLALGMLLALLHVLGRALVPAGGATVPARPALASV